MPSALRTLEQERAKHAWDCVQEVKDKYKHIAGDYRAIAVKVPSLIVTNGLGQTLAFLKAKGKGESGNEHEVLYRHLTDWVGRKVNANGDLLNWLLNTATSQQYRLATMEALALLQWLKRFAEAELPKGREG
jgi:CRISPR-associated protein Cmr5